MRTKNIVAAVVVATGLGAGLATVVATPVLAAPADGGMDSAFLEAIRDKGLKVGTDDAAIDLARSTCAVLARTESVTSAMRHVQNATEWKDPKDISDFGSLAVQAYCPGSLPK